MVSPLCEIYHKLKSTSITQQYHTLILHKDHTGAVMLRPLAQFDRSTHIILVGLVTSLLIMSMRNEL